MSGTLPPLSPAARRALRVLYDSPLAFESNVTAASRTRPTIYWQSRRRLEALGLVGQVGKGSAIYVLTPEGWRVARELFGR